MAEFQSAFGRCLKLQFREASEVLELALLEEIEANVEIGVLVENARAELGEIARLQLPYVLYALTFEGQDGFLFCHIHDELRRPWWRMVDVIMSACTEERPLVEVRDHLVVAVQQGWAACVAAARAELAQEIEAWHLNRVQLRSQCFLPRLLLPKDADPVEVALQMGRELPWLVL
jgi:hypothetical protein